MVTNSTELKASTEVSLIETGEKHDRLGRRITPVARLGGTGRGVARERLDPDACAYLLGHNPHDYLKDVLTRLPAMTNQDDLRPLLPGQWKNPAAPAAAATPVPTV